MAVAQRERAYQKYAWVLLIPGGLPGLILFLGPLLGLLGPPPGYTPGPLDFVFAPLIWVMGIVQLFVGPTAFRKGTKWGWYLILLAWLVALANGIYDSIVASPSTGVGTFFVFGGPALLALLLAYRKFFPKKQPVSP